MTKISVGLELVDDVVEIGPSRLCTTSVGVGCKKDEICGDSICEEIDNVGTDEEEDFTFGMTFSVSDCVKILD